MIDEMQMLMDVIGQITDGALWAFGIYMVVKVVAITVWPIILLLVVGKIAVVFYRLIAANGLEEKTIDLYEILYKGTRYGQYVGSGGELEDFLGELRNEGERYINSSDLRQATNIIKHYKDKVS